MAGEVVDLYSQELTMKKIMNAQPRRNHPSPDVTTLRGHFTSSR